jgi:hypothetical protein
MPITNTSVKHHEDLPVSQHSWKMNFAYSAFTGGAVGCVFHPWDRALHLSILNKKPFFLKANFTKPMQGVSLVMLFKPFTSGSYLFLQSELQQHLKPALLANKQSESTANILIGLTSGSLEGMLKTPCNAMKAYCWNHPGISTFHNIAEMIRQPKGPRFLVAGGGNTMQRDAVFGSVYEFTRGKLRNLIDTKAYSSGQVMGWNFISDGLAAGMATISCSPWNLSRILNQSKKPQDKPISSTQVIRQLYHETMAQTTFKAKRKYLFTSLGIGPGTLRVMTDMPVKQLLLVCLPILLKKLESTVQTIDLAVRDSYRKYKQR